MSEVYFVLRWNHISSQAVKKGLIRCKGPNSRGHGTAHDCPALLVWVTALGTRQDKTLFMIKRPPKTQLELVELAYTKTHILLACLTFSTQWNHGDGIRVRQTCSTLTCLAVANGLCMRTKHPWPDWWVRSLPTYLLLSLCGLDLALVSLGLDLCGGDQRRGKLSFGWPNEASYIFFSSAGPSSPTL